MDIMMPNVRIARCAARLIDNTARFSSPLSGTVRTVGRPGDYWAFRVDYEYLKDTERARLDSVIAYQRGAANRLLFSPPDWIMRGAFGLSEKVPAPYFQNLTNWTTSGAAFTVADQIARVQNTGAASGRATSPVLGVISGNFYVARAVALPGSTSNWKFNAGTTPGGTDIFSRTMTTPGLSQYPVVGPAGGDVYLSLVVDSAVSGDFVQFSYVSLSKAIRVEGASQLGSQLNVHHLPTSTAGLLLPGDWVGIGMELKKIIAPLNSNGSGSGTMHFSPPIRVSPSDDGEVVVTAPLGRFVLANNESGWETVPGQFASSSYDLREVI